MSPLVGALILLLPAATPSDQIQERARAVVGQSGFQTTIPEGPHPLIWELPAGPVVVILKLLLVASLLVAVVLVSSWLVRRFAPGLRDEQENVGAEAAAAPACFQTVAAERLAASGRYAEAIHTLLLETLATLSNAAQLSPSLTSREIVIRAPMPSGAREALRALALAVEITHFGGAKPTESDYRTCRARHQAFLESYRSPA